MQQPQAQISAQTKVQARRVIYIPGYDPVPPRKYRERYRREAAKQATLSGHQITLSPKTGTARFGWHVSAKIEGQSVETEVEVAYWADIVRSSMATGIAATYGQLLRTAWIYIGSGALWRLMRLRKGPVIAALYPVLMLLAQLLLALSAGGLVAYGFWLAIPTLLPEGGALARLAGGGGLLVGGAVARVVLNQFRRRDPWLAWYLMHDYAFSAQHHGAYPAAQEARMRDFADQIATALDSDVDEVLVIGHSSGAYIAISILADLLRAGRVRDGGPAVSLLT